MQHLSTRLSSRPLRVLDLGCGPGTNAALFLDQTRFEYTGIDSNPAYIRQAAQRYPLHFKCADATRLGSTDEKFDVVLINSVLHHISPEETARMLRAARGLLDADGECLVLDMVKSPGSTLIQRALIRMDRGKYCRTVEELRAEIGKDFTIEASKAFNIHVLGIMLWELRLFVARART